MAKAIGRREVYSGEVVRLYETEKNRPGHEAKKALAIVFDKPEAYIEYGVSLGREKAAGRPNSVASKRAGNAASPASILERMERDIEMLRRALGDNASTNDRPRKYQRRAPGGRRKSDKPNGADREVQ